MLEEKLHAIIPKNLSIFPKLTGGKDPYFFFKWDFDKKKNSPILRYWFWGKKRKNKKRVFIDEFEALTRFSLGKGGFDRSDFERLCPNTLRDGDCGFAIFVRILEYHNLITRVGPGSYSVKYIDKLRELID